MRRNTTLATIHRTSRRNPDDRGEPGVGTTSGDTQAELRSYSVANRHEAVRFAPSRCDCG